MPKTTTRAKAEAHEALYLRLAAALLQVTAIAARHPDAAVPAETRAIAEALLFDSRPFTRSFYTSPLRGESLPPTRSGVGPEDRVRGPFRVHSKVRGLPAAATTSAALASQLAEVKAALEMWEAAHSAWNGECYVWRLTRGEEPLPIQRLRPRVKLRDREDRRQAGHLREMLGKRIDARFGEGYHQGYADAQAGRDPRPGEFTIATRIAQLNRG